MSVRLYVETRGRERAADYRFLGDGPAEPWWATRYGDRTAFESPTVLVERDGRGVRIYLGAIPSSRLDPAGATNRVSIVAEADDLATDERHLILAMVTSWVDDIADGGRSVADTLDTVFDEDTVARLYGAGDERTDDAASLVLKAARSLREPAAASTTDIPKSWIAPVGSEEARAEFVRRVDDLLCGTRTGSAVLVNLTDDAADFAEQARTGIAVLVQDRDRALSPTPTEIDGPPMKVPTNVADLRTPGKAQARRRGGSTRRRTMIRRVLVTIGAIVLLAVAAAITVVIAGRSAQNPSQKPQPPPTPLPSAIVAPAQPGNAHTGTTPAQSSPPSGPSSSR